MPGILVLGGGVCGLAAAMLLARDGHDVTVLERDPDQVPDAPADAWEKWPRKGAAQFRQPHFMQARVRQVLDEELPDVRDALLAAGAVRVDPMTRLPAAIADREPRAGDERFLSVSARRPALEQVVARIAGLEPRLTIRRGVAASELMTRVVDGTPHVTGLRTESGEELASELVVDAMGRRSPLPRWLREAGAAPVHEEAEDCGFVYYTRFFQARNGSVPAPRTPGLLTPIGSFSILTLPSEHDTWGVTLYIASRDRPLKRLKDVDRWTAVVAACPLHAHWLDGEPITGLLPMGGVIDRYRRLVHDGRLVATAVVLLADAWACTNPSLGRGVALGLAHAARLRDVVREQLGNPRELAGAWDAVTEAEFTPWYRATIAVDRARLAEIDALRAGLDPPQPANPAEAARVALPFAVRYDGDVFRAFMEIVGCLTLPQEVLARPDIVERIQAVLDSGERPPAAGPSRKELLTLVA